MGKIAVRIDPTKLANPDLDIRYELPDLVEHLTGGDIIDDGYDYDADDENTLLVFFSCKDPEVSAKHVLEILKKHQVCGNPLLDTVVIGISEESQTFQTVHPTKDENFTVRQW